MDQITSIIIIALALIVLGVFVIYSLMQRAKYDPQSLENKFFSEFDMYDAQAKRGGAMIAKRSQRPTYPDINDPKYMLAWAKEKEAEERIKMLRLEELELWEEGHR